MKSLQAEEIFKSRRHFSVDTRKGIQPKLTMSNADYVWTTFPAAMNVRRRASWLSHLSRVCAWQNKLHIIVCSYGDNFPMENNCGRWITNAEVALHRWRRLPPGGVVAFTLAVFKWMCDGQNVVFMRWPRSIGIHCDDGHTLLAKYVTSQHQRSV